MDTGGCQVDSWEKALHTFLGEGNGNPLQYSCLENPMDREAWQAMVYGVTKSQTQLSNLAHCIHLNMVYLEVHGITENQT